MSKSDVILSKKYLKKYENIISLINKQVDFRFYGENLKFLLSQGLFSSFNIDRGSALLLKTVAKHINISPKSTVIDVGCGIGTIGLSIKKKFPEITLYCTDRDALAARFTEINAELNNIEDCNISGVLGIGTEKREYDLIVSNLPAKAGNKVLEYLLVSFLLSLSDKGTAAVVIVKTLKDFANKLLININAEIVFLEDSKDYSVFHFKRAGKKLEEYNFSISKYIRKSIDFNYKKIRYNLHTVYNLPDFDTIGYQARLAMELLSLLKIEGRALFYKPGQGHLPVFTSIKNDITEYCLAGRDLLELEISKHNLKDKNISNIDSSHISCYKDLSFKDKFDLIVFLPGITWNKNLYFNLFEFLKSMTNKYGIIIIAAKSTWIHRLLEFKHNLKIINDKKLYGFRGIVLKNNSL